MHLSEQDATLAQADATTRKAVEVMSLIHIYLSHLVAHHGDLTADRITLDRCFGILS